MRLSVISAAAAAAMALAGAAAPASAQVGFGVYVGPSDDYEYGYRSYDYAPRTYGYSNTYEYDARPGVAVRTPSSRNGCGEYFYWNGNRCVDARVTPPDIR